MSCFPTNLDEFKATFPGVYSLDGGKGPCLYVWFGEGVMLVCEPRGDHYEASWISERNEVTRRGLDWVATVAEVLAVIEDALQARVETAQENLARFKAAAARPAR